MPDQEVRLEILRALQDFYNEDPYGFLEKQNLMERIESDIEENN